MPMKLTPEQERENLKAYLENEKITKISGLGIIESVEERFETVYVSGFGENVVNNQISLGWFVRLRGSTAVFVGIRQPPSHFRKGATVKLSIEIEQRSAEAVQATAEVPPKPKIDTTQAGIDRANAQAAEFTA